jgi:hypothetical protein
LRTVGGSGSKKRTEDLGVFDEGVNASGSSTFIERRAEGLGLDAFGDGVRVSGEEDSRLTVFFRLGGEADCRGFVKDGLGR